MDQLHYYAIIVEMEQSFRELKYMDLLLSLEYEHVSVKRQARRERQQVS